MAGYCSNLPWSFWLIYAARKAQWQAWQVFPKLQQRQSKKGEDDSRRIEITMGITCHACHAFAVFALGKQFRDIATYHRTCHGLVTRSVESVDGPRADILTEGQHAGVTHKPKAELANAAADELNLQHP